MDTKHSTRAAASVCTAHSTADAESPGFSQDVLRMLYKDALIEQLSSLPSGWATAMAEASNFRTVAEHGNSTAPQRRMSSLRGDHVLSAVSDGRPDAGGATGKQRWKALSSVLS